MRDAGDHLAQRRELLRLDELALGPLQLLVRLPLGTLEAQGVFGLVRFLDNGQVEVEQLVQRPDRLMEQAEFALPDSAGGNGTRPVRSRDSATLV